MGVSLRGKPFGRKCRTLAQLGQATTVSPVDLNSCNAESRARILDPDWKPKHPRGAEQSVGTTSGSPVPQQPCPLSASGSMRTSANGHVSVRVHSVVSVIHCQICESFSEHCLDLSRTSTVDWDRPAAWFRQHASSAHVSLLTDSPWNNARSPQRRK